MKKKTYLLIGILCFVFTTQTFSQNSVKIDYSDEEIFGKEVFKALKSDNYSLMIKFLPTTEDLDELVKATLENNPNMPEAEKKKMTEGLNEFQTKRIKEAKEEFNKIRNLGIEKGIEWNMTTLKTIEYEIKKREGIVKGNIYLIFEFLGAKYIIDLDDCLKVSRTWLIGDDIRFKGEY